jgi:hypothetical protein
MQPMRSEGGCHGVKGPPFYSCGCEVGVCFFNLCLNFGVESGLSIVHFPLGRLTVGVPFFLGLAGGVVKPKSSQVSDLFPKEFPIAPYFYPICFGKCCPPFTYIHGVSYYLVPMFPLGANGKICGRAPCGFTKLHCPMCEALYSRSVVCLCVVSFLEREYPRKSHTVGILLSSMVFLSRMRNERCTPASIAPTLSVLKVCY